MTTGEPGEPGAPGAQPGEPQEPQAPPPPAAEPQAPAPPPAEPPGRWAAPPPPPYGQPPQYGGAPEYAQAPQYGAPQYGQPAYGAPQYGQPPYGGYGPPRQPIGTSARSFGIVGAVIALVGAILGIVAFTATNWFDGPADSHFSDVHDAVKLLDRFKVANGVSVAYFGWLAWVLLAAAVVFALIANIPSSASTAFRVIGPLVAAAGIALTFLAIQLTTKSGIGGSANSYGDYLKHARVAFYLALAGFLFAGIGAALGPRRT